MTVSFLGPKAEIEILQALPPHVWNEGFGLMNKKVMSFYLAIQNKLYSFVPLLDVLTIFISGLKAQWLFKKKNKQEHYSKNRTEFVLWRGHGKGLEIKQHLSQSQKWSKSYKPEGQKKNNRPLISKVKNSYVQNKEN